MGRGRFLTGGGGRSSGRMYRGRRDRQRVCGLGRELKSGNEFQETMRRRADKYVAGRKPLGFGVPYYVQNSEKRKESS